MLYKWIYPADHSHNESFEYGNEKIPESIKGILASRNIKDTNQLNKYIDPKLNDLYDPFIFPEMEKASNRVISALKNGENILIYGDYDVDGVTSVCILYEAFHLLGGKVSFHIPDRNKEGYGISEAGLNKAINKGISLLITVDCGITAVKQISRALANSIDTIICDHHEGIGHLPKAYAILNPKLENNPYPFKDLAGCGVAFKLLQAICQKLSIDDEFLYSFLDYVALGTAADIVNIIDENRILVYHGLKKIHQEKRRGIASLINLCGLNSKKISVRNIVFSIAPRINAVGRISSAKKAVHLLTSRSEQQSKNIAQILNEENNKRRKIDEQTLREAEKLLNENSDLKNAKILVLAREGWHIGVIGIVASRLLEKYNKPVILISVENGIGKASVRSIESFNAIFALKKLENLLTSFGGHKRAAGFSIIAENIEPFRNEINRIAQKSMEDTEEGLYLNIDGELAIDQYDPSLFKWLKMMEPYGPGNMRPVFVSNNLEISGDMTVLANDHLKFKVKQNGFVIDAIAFNMRKFEETLNEQNNLVNIAYSIEENNWQGQVTVQLRIRDFEVTNGNK